MQMIFRALHEGVQSVSVVDVQPSAQQPSPPTHVVIGEQVDGSPLHAEQDSGWQEKQPSPPPKLPSSHPSPGSSTPLPQSTGVPVAAVRMRSRSPRLPGTRNIVRVASPSCNLSASSSMPRSSSLSG